MTTTRYHWAVYVCVWTHIHSCMHAGVSAYLLLYVITCQWFPSSHSHSESFNSSWSQLGFKQSQFKLQVTALADICTTASIILSCQDYKCIQCPLSFSCVLLSKNDILIYCGISTHAQMSWKNTHISSQTLSYCLVRLHTLCILYMSHYNYVHSEKCILENAKWHDALIS